jgi:hypothetical protein
LPSESDRVTIAPSRVTRLGEFSPIGQFFTLASVLKITVVVQIFEMLFSTVPAMY